MAVAPAPPQFSHALLQYHLTRWPQLDELRLAADARSIRRYRWRHALSSLAACARTELLGAIFAGRSRMTIPTSSNPEAISHITAISYGTLRYEALTILRDGGLAALSCGWSWSAEQSSDVLATVQSLIGASFAHFTTVNPLPPPTLEPKPTRFPHITTLPCAVMAAGWQWPTALAVMARLCWGRYSINTRQFWCCSPEGRLTAQSTTTLWQHHFIPSTAPSDPDISIFFAGLNPILIQSSLPLRPSHDKPGKRATSNFLPSFIRLPTDAQGRPSWPKFSVTSIIERRAEWYKLIGNIDGVTSAILEGRMVYPRLTWLLRGSWLRNHPSFERPEVKLKLGLKIGTYIAQGAIECLRTGDPTPLYVEPNAAVDKPGPDIYRLIGDSRKGNEGLSAWGIRLHSAQDFAALLDWCYWAFLDDVSDAYHLACFMGCRNTLVWAYGVIGIEPDPDDSSAWRLVWGMRLHVGCSPGDCFLACDKSATGFCIDGWLMRWAVAHFGQAPAGAPLNAIAMCLLRYMKQRSPPHQRRAAPPTGAPAQPPPIAPRGTQGVVWVDDFAFAGFVPPHPPCRGGLLGCPTCLAALPAAKEDRAHFRGICPRLGVGLNDDKTQDCTQTPAYAGFGHDTVTGRRHILPKKNEKLIDSIVSLGCCDRATAREVDRVRGRAIHYSACIDHLRVPCASLARLLGSDGPITYDFEVCISHELRALCGRMLDIVFQHGPRGSEMWPVPPATLYEKFSHGIITSRMFTLTWDAGPTGWAALARWWDTPPSGRRELKELRLVGTWPSYADTSEQAHRETWAGALAFLALSRAMDIRTSTILLRNDASAAISAFRKGSFASPQLQAAATMLNDARAKLDVITPLLHVPGLTLVQEGIDGASRHGAAFGHDANVAGILGPAVSDTLWSTILELANRVQWRLTIDLFASASNHRTDRFVSWFPEPDAEAFDAFSIGNWGSSMCPLCGLRHTEAIYAFPPPALLTRLVAKAVADRAVGIIVVPLLVTSPVWHKLQLASVLPGRDGYVRIRRARRLLDHAQSLSTSSPDLALFPCDFGRLRGTPDGWSDPGCAGAFRSRPRPPCGSRADEDDRHLLRSLLPREVHPAALHPRH